jgi:hypothetical protein
MNASTYRFRLLAACALAAAFAQAGAVRAQEPSTIVMWNRDFDNAPVRAMLQEALEKTVESHGPFDLQSSKTMTDTRAFMELSAGTIHVMSFAPSEAMERDYRPVLIPINKGLLGLRVGLIRKGEQSRFDGVSSLEDWKASGLKMGQGKEWPDTFILEANGIEVIKNVDYLPLFGQLVHKRFDFFPRAISEIDGELERFKDGGIALEENLAFVYRLPLFFWVAKDNAALAERIEAGMKAMMADGSFDRAFMERFGETIERMGIAKRTIIPLENPFLSEQVRSIDPSYWYDIEAAPESE